MNISKIPVRSRIYQSRDLDIWDLIYVATFKIILLFKSVFWNKSRHNFLGPYVSKKKLPSFSIYVFEKLYIWL